MWPTNVDISYASLGNFVASFALLFENRRKILPFSIPCLKFVKIIYFGSCTFFQTLKPDVPERPKIPE